MALSAAQVEAIRLHQHARGERAPSLRVGGDHHPCPVQYVRSQPEDSVVQQGVDESARRGDLVVVEHPAERTAQLRYGGVDLRQDRLTRLQQSGIRTVDPVDEVPGVPLRDRVGSARTDELFGAERPQRLEQHVPATGHPHHQRTLHEVRQRRDGRPGIRAADRRGVGRVERAGEHRQVREGPSQILREQPERPRHGRGQRRVPWGRAVPRRQQLEAVVQARRDLRDLVGV